MLIDAHAHLSFLPENEAKAIIDAEAEAIGHWFFGGYSPSEWKNQDSLKSLFPKKLHTCFGLHPWAVCDSTSVEVKESLDALEKRLEGAALIGEVGIDTSNEMRRQKFDLQIHAFKIQLEWAYVLKRPVVIHCVGGAQEILSELKNYSLNGFIHGFTSSVELAREFISQGMMISVGPNVLKDNFKNLRKVVTEIDLQHLLIETDSPTSPDDKTYTGSKMLKNILQEIACLKKISEETVETQILQNVLKLGVFP